MQKMFSMQVMRKVWLVSLVYLLALAISFISFLAEAHLSVRTELLLKATALCAFVGICGPPLAYLAVRFRAGKSWLALRVAGYATIIGYVWLLGWLAYVKFKTCDVSAIPHDASWYCNVEGMQIVSYVVVIPIVAAICGVVAGGVAWLVHKR